MAYLVKTKSETLIFYYDKNRGICYRNEQEDTVHILTEESEGIMDVVATDEIHLVCQSKKGELLYFWYHIGQWYKRVILKSKHEVPSFHYLRLTQLNADVTLFYILEHQGQYLLVCHPLKGIPEPVTQVSGRRFLLRKDKYENLYLIYRKGEESFYQCYGNGKWSQAFLLGNVEVADGIFTEEHSAHLACFQKGNLFYFRLEHKKITEKYEVAKGEWTPALLFYENKIWVLYEERGRLFYWNKNGKNPVSLITGNQPRLFHIRVDGEREKIRLAYGCQRGTRISLFLCSSIPMKTDSERTKESAIELKKLKLRIEALEQEIRQLTQEKFKN